MQDPPGPLSQIPESVICSPEHTAVARAGASQSASLLKNLGKALPLSAGSAGKVAVIGPNGELSKGIAGYCANPILPIRPHSRSFPTPATAATAAAAAAAARHHTERSRVDFKQLVVLVPVPQTVPARCVVGITTQWWTPSHSTPRQQCSSRV